MSTVAFAVTLLVSYCCIGTAIKLIDDLSDTLPRFRGRSVLSWTATAGAVILIDFWVWIDPYTDGLALALLLALVVAWKVNNRYFLAMALTTMPFALLPILQPDSLLLILPILLTLAPSAVLDEALDAVGPRFRHAGLRLLATSRPVMKAIVLALAFWGLLTVFHAIAFWGFDIAYGLTGYGLRALSGRPRTGHLPG